MSKRFLESEFKANFSIKEMQSNHIDEIDCQSQDHLLTVFNEIRGLRRSGYGVKCSSSTVGKQ